MGNSNGNENFSISKVLPIHYFFHSGIAITNTLLKKVMNYVLPIQVMNYFNSMTIPTLQYSSFYSYQYTTK